jgi:hypothetical protein
VRERHLRGSRSSGGSRASATILIRTPAAFYVLRFLLGAFEAGLLPGAVLYLTYAPFAVGWLRDQTGQTSKGLYVVAALEVIGAVLILRYLPRSSAHQHHSQPGSGQRSKGR